MTKKHKRALTIDQQIKHLIEKKNVKFNGEKEIIKAKKYLRKYSYTDVINPLKVLFASNYNYENNCHQYDFETNWKDIQSLHSIIKKKESKILNELIHLELNIKSIFCDWITSEINKNNTDIRDFFNKIEWYDSKSELWVGYNIKVKKYKKDFKLNYQKNGYDKNHENSWWLLIACISFGEFQKLLSARYKLDNDKTVLDELIKYINKNKIKLKYIEIIGPGKKYLETIVILRNALCHQTNLLIFLDQPLYISEGSTNESIKAEQKTKYKMRRDVVGTLAKSKLNSVFVEYESIRNNKNKKRGKFTFKKYHI